MNIAPMQIFFRSFNRAVKESPTGASPDMVVSKGWVEALCENTLWISNDKIDWPHGNWDTIKIGPHICRIDPSLEVFVVAKQKE